MKKVKIEDVLFNYSIPEDRRFIPLYEHFLELKNLANEDVIYSTKDLECMPKEDWYVIMNQLIDDVGYETYRNHLLDCFEGINLLQSSHNRINSWIKANRKKTGKLTHAQDYIDRGDNHFSKIQEAPTHFYFYSSERSRYLKGMILSVACIPDPELLRAIEQFSIHCPFQVGSVSQAVTGLYVYDVLEVFSRLEYSESIPYILNMKASIKQTYAQKRFEKYLLKIAKEQRVDYDDLIEYGIPEYGFTSDFTYIATVGRYNMILSFSSKYEKEIYWVDNDCGKKQKSVPKTIRLDYPEQLKYIKSHTKDIEVQLKVQSKRIENQFLRDRLWDVNTWNEKYLNHNFIGLITKQLLWVFESSVSRVIVYVDNGVLKNLEGAIVDLNDYKNVKLWHPIYGIDAIKLNNIGFLKDQPFKQIGREVYTIDFIEKSIGSFMDKATLSQLCKSRNWTTSSNSLKIPDSGYTVKLNLKGLKNESIGRFGKDEVVELISVELKYKRKNIPFSKLNEVVLSEVIRDIDLFITKSKR